MDTDTAPTHLLPITIEVVDGIEAVDAKAWDALAGGNPTVSHAYLHALHASGSATRKTGWQPQYLVAKRGGALVGGVPLYAKTHSYGEYVFDWAWAEAHERHGIDYYPKFLCAVPFTPVSGARLLASDDAVRQALAAALVRLAERAGVSSLHVLFPQERDGAALAAVGLMPRGTVQFHWQNPGYQSFEEFLAGMSHDKRKRIRQERRHVLNVGITFTHKRGTDITERDWDFFYRCYTHTYLAHRSTPYLTRDFFRRIAHALSNHILLAIGAQNGEEIAASLCIIAPGMQQPTLFGRYWGALQFVSGLHFEACYYQPIEFAIAQKLAVFEGGAQGEHKLARGLLPVRTASYHWLRHPAFANAIDDYLQREGVGISGYIDELEVRSPFNKGTP